MRSQALLFVGLLLIYNVNLRQVSSHDTYASRFVPISILRDGDVILDEFVPEAHQAAGRRQFFSNYFVYVRGHFYDSHPPVGPLLALPVYALPAWIGIPDRARAHRQHVFEAGRVADGRALGCVDLSSVEAGADPNAHGHGSRRRTRDPHRVPRGDRVRARDRCLVDGEPRDVDAHACRAGFRSGAVGVDHGACRRRRRCGRGSVLLEARDGTRRCAARAVSGCIARSRDGWNSAGAVQRRMDVLRFSAAAAFTGLTGVLYNYWLFNNAVGGAPFRTGYWVEELGTTGMFTGSLPVGLAGLTVSPSRGILIFSPIVLVAVYGAVESVAVAARLRQDACEHSAALMPSCLHGTRALRRLRFFSRTRSSSSGGPAMATARGI